MPIAPELIPKIKMVAPGTVLRRAPDDITMAEFGALIVFLDDIEEQENILQGGFFIGTGFSPEKLYELAKMDGAIILDESVARILAANVQLAPDPTLPTNETGMRHRAAERTARQTQKFVLTISRRRKVITLYYKNHKHQLKEINTLIARISQTVGTVERYKNDLDKKCLRIERDEFLDQVQLIQVTELLNDCVGIMNLLEEIDPYVIETGSEGHLLVLRLNSVREDVDTLARLFVKDYSFNALTDDDIAPVIEKLKSVKPADHEKIAGLLDWPSAAEATLHDINVRPRGYRLLKQMAKIPPGTADKVVDQFKDLVRLGMADEAALLEVEGIGEKRARSIVEGIQHMRNRIVYR
ncbi:DNA integrity scanning diadenylate cyclase DisA [uncultured Desulfosarcina sp.]|uniref:DNA integrity scanning diadenylate cyclase DisA n=1 Tax=uncultured Desulfosarcina sp. TaxID=218289 RepID=UPI0029C6C872|nr:DNA integrity scanning diadenylate cyclase DisA [uncultured Desulfosarcina sp.]